MDNDNSTATPRADFGFNNTFFDSNGTNLGETALITWWDTGGINDFYSLDTTTARGFIVEFDSSLATPLPEPSTLALVGLCLAGLAITRGKRAS